MSHYIGVLEGEGDVWSVWFPDILGCVGAGADPDAAVRDATSALSLVVEMMTADGEQPPQGRDQRELMQDAWVAEAVGKGDALVRIPVIVNSGRPTRANISLDAGLLHAIDSAAKARGLTRSTFIASTMRDKILESV